MLDDMEKTDIKIGPIINVVFNFLLDPFF